MLVATAADSSFGLFAATLGPIGDVLPSHCQVLQFTCQIFQLRAAFVITSFNHPPAHSLRLGERADPTLMNNAMRKTGLKIARQSALVMTGSERNGLKTGSLMR